MTEYLMSFFNNLLALFNSLWSHYPILSLFGLLLEASGEMDYINFRSSIFFLTWENIHVRSLELYMPHADQMGIGDGA